MIYRYFDIKSKRVVGFTREFIESENFVPLTYDQTAFFVANRKATYDEIWACALNVPTPPVVVEIEEPTLEELKAQYIEALSKLSLEILGGHVTEYQLMNARLSLEVDAADKIYDDEKSEEVIATYLSVGKICRETFYSAKSEIEACDDINELKEIYDEYSNLYEEERRA